MEGSAADSGALLLAPLAAVVLLASIATAAGDTPGSFSPTGSMTVKRGALAAAPLPRRAPARTLGRLDWLIDPASGEPVAPGEPVPKLAGQRIEPMWSRWHEAC